MTSDEAIKTLNYILEVADKSDCGIKEIDGIDEEAINMGIEALKQFNVLQKVRKEIEASSHGKWYVGRLDGKTEEVLLLDEVLEIIDNYSDKIYYRGNKNEFR